MTGVANLRAPEGLQLFHKELFPRHGSGRRALGPREEGPLDRPCVSSINPLETSTWRTNTNTLRCPLVLSPSHQSLRHSLPLQTTIPNSPGPVGVAKIIMKSLSWDPYKRGVNSLLKYL